MKTFSEFLNEKKLEIKSSSKEISPIIKDFNVLGSGVQSIVYENKKHPNSIIKLSYIKDESDATYQFLRLCVNHQDNQYLPKIFAYKLYESKELTDEDKLQLKKFNNFNINDKTHKVLLTVVEKLKPILSLDINTQIKVLKNAGVPVDLDNKEISSWWDYFMNLLETFKIEFLIKNNISKDIINLRRVLKPLFNRYGDDLNINNIMVRDNNHIVITDPIVGLDF